LQKQKKIVYYNCTSLIKVFFMNRQKTITIPTHVLERMHDAFSAWSEAESALEDFLLSKDRSFLKKMTQARTEHEEGNVTSFAELKKKIYST